MSPLPKKSLLILFSLLIISYVLPQAACLAEVAIVKINFRDASEILPMVETLLSPQGRASADRRTNSIVVHDDGESIKKIREFLARSDRPLEQVTIRFRFHGAGVKEGSGISASGRISDDKWSVSAGKRPPRGDGVRVRAKDRTVRHRQDSESFVTVLSGSAAYIRVGEAIPYTERWVYLSRRYARVVETTGFQHIETGMEVRPVVSGENVHVEITPRIAYQKPGDKGVIRFAEASTKVFVRKGEWITISGDSKKSNEVIREILSMRSAEDRSTLSLSLMVEP